MATPKEILDMEKSKTKETFRCPICDHKFKSEKQLKKHIEARHLGNTIEQKIPDGPENRPTFLENISCSKCTLALRQNWASLRQFHKQGRLLDVINFMGYSQEMLDDRLLKIVQSQCGPFKINFSFGVLYLNEYNGEIQHFSPTQFSSLFYFPLRVDVKEDMEKIKESLIKDNPIEHCQSLQKYFGGPFIAIVNITAYIYKLSLKYDRDKS